MRITNPKVTVIAICALAVSVSLKAQYLGDQLVGLTGLKAGSQPPPGTYVTLPLYYGHYDISTYNAQGDQILKNSTASLNVFMLPSLQIVAPFKVLGASVGASFSEWIINGVLNQATLNFQRSSSYAYGDIYIQPLVLGWHLARADVTAGYAFFAPTGAGLAGRHMWVNELDLGTTVYLDPAKHFNASAMMFYDFNRPKRNTNITVGDIVTLTGGIGRSFLKGAANAGVAYGAQWKTTHDSGSDIPPFLPITNGRVFGVGPELDMPVFAKGRNVGIVQFRYLWLPGPKTEFGGRALTATFTFARLFVPR